jgi:hypothetical protein
VVNYLLTLEFAAENIFPKTIDKDGEKMYIYLCVLATKFYFYFMKGIPG